MVTCRVSDPIIGIGILFCHFVSILHVCVANMSKRSQTRPAVVVQPRTNLTQITPSATSELLVSCFLYTKPTLAYSWQAGSCHCPNSRRCSSFVEQWMNDSKCDNFVKTPQVAVLATDVQRLKSLQRLTRVFAKKSLQRLESLQRLSLCTFVTKTATGGVFSKLRKRRTSG